jgi:DNA polymerase III subunit epsilon
MRIAQEIRRVEWIETAGELGALLLEARLVKELQPLHNRQLRRERTLCAWRLDDNPNAKPLVIWCAAMTCSRVNLGRCTACTAPKTKP